MESVLTRPRALRALIGLRKAEPDPASAARFQRIVGYEGADRAADVREDLLTWGLVVVQEHDRSIRISLTPPGRLVADLAASIARHAPDLLDHPRGFSALALIRESAPEPLTAGRLQDGLGADVATAAATRTKLAQWGLVTVEEGYHRKLPFVRVSLTPTGRTVTDLATEIITLATKARAAARRSKR